MTERNPERLGLELVAWLGSILAGLPGSAARFVDDLTLVVTGRGSAETGRCMGRHSAVLDPLEALAQRLNERLGLLIRVQMSEAG